MWYLILHLYHKGYVIMLRRILCFFLLATSATVTVQASDIKSGLNITVTVNGRPTVAEVTLLKHGKSSYVYTTLYQPGGPALQTPLDIELPAGVYDVRVKPAFVDEAVQSQLKEKRLSLTVEEARKVTKTVDFPTARLSVSAREDGGAALASGAIAIGKGWVSTVTGGRYMPLPAKFELAPGKYTIQVENQSNKVRSHAQIQLVAGQDLNQVLVLDKSQMGSLQIELLKDGKALTSDEANRYATVTISATKTHKPVQPLSGGYGRPSLLPSGSYDVLIHMLVLGAKDKTLRGIRIGDGQKVVRSVVLPPTGSLKLPARWTQQPINLMACAHYYNPFEHLGGLMGGSSGSRGSCYDPVVGALNVRLVRTDRSDESLKINMHGEDKLVVPGTYDITVWPYDTPELSRTIKDVNIIADKLTEKTLEFPWPYIEKQIDQNGKSITVLERKQPTGNGTLKLSATVNGMVKPIAAEISVKKLDSYGRENSSFFQYHAPKGGGKPGIVLPLTVSIPDGDYHIYVRPYGEHRSMLGKQIEIEMHADDVVKQTFDFPAGRLKVSGSEREMAAENMYLQITGQAGVHMLSNAQNHHLPLDIELPPDKYTLKMYKSGNVVYDTDFEVVAGKTVNKAIPSVVSH
jgi:hypothetical protein